MMWSGNSNCGVTDEQSCPSNLFSPFKTVRFSCPLYGCCAFPPALLNTTDSMPYSFVIDNPSSPASPAEGTLTFGEQLFLSSDCTGESVTPFVVGASGWITLDNAGCKDGDPALATCNQGEFTWGSVFSVKAAVSSTPLFGPPERAPAVAATLQGLATREDSKDVLG